MTRFIVRRVLLGLVTLWLLSVLVFFALSVLPGDVGRRVLGPFASQSAVDQLNHKLGTDRSLIVQYGDWVGGVLHGDLGTSLKSGQPVSDIVWPALGHSAKLAILAFIIVVPLAILGGVFAALHEGRPSDRIVSIGGLSATAIPEFVWAVVFILVFALWLGVLPSTAQPPPGAGLLTQIE